MKKILILLVTFQFAFEGISQTYDYDVSAKNPYGLLNPKAPKETADYALLIGKCDCKSIARIDQNTWADTVSMTWTFKYIMNGMAVQDETLKADGAHSGSIRQYSADSSRWYVHYYSAASSIPSSLPSWEGHKKENGDIVHYKDSPAPNGAPGYYRLSFTNVTTEGYDWAGEWTNKEETFVYPTWKIFCKRKGN